MGLGAGKAGGASAALAAPAGANVTVFEMRQDRMDEMMRLGHNVNALYPYHDVVARALAAADLVVGAVPVAGAPAPPENARRGPCEQRVGYLLGPRGVPALYT